MEDEVLILALKDAAMAVGQHISAMQMIVRKTDKNRFIQIVPFILFRSFLLNMADNTSTLVLYYKIMSKSRYKCVFLQFLYRNMHKNEKEWR